MAVVQMGKSAPQMDSPIVGDKILFAFESECKLERKGNLRSENGNLC